MLSQVLYRELMDQYMDHMQIKFEHKMFDKIHYYYELLLKNNGGARRNLSKPVVSRHY